ncbi:hypothetical protein B0O99DRAFT_503190, partial [Bisporella sp. PMI_857]
TVTYDHRLRRTGHPVRSAIHKPQIGRLVVGWVTTSESLLLYVLHLSFFFGRGSFRRPTWRALVRTCFYVYATGVKQGNLYCPTEVQDMCPLKDTRQLLLNVLTRDRLFSLCYNCLTRDMWSLSED